MTGRLVGTRRRNSAYHRTSKLVVLGCLATALTLRGCSILEYETAWHIHARLVAPDTGEPLRYVDVSVRILRDGFPYGEYSYDANSGSNGEVDITFVEHYGGYPGGSGFCGEYESLPPAPLGPVPDEIEWLLHSRLGEAAVRQPVPAEALTGYDNIQHVRAIGFLELGAVEVALAPLPPVELLRFLRQPYHILAGDVDSDSDLDLIVAGYDDRADISTSINSGTGGFAETRVIAEATYADSFAAGDLDADGDLDLVAYRQWRYKYNEADDPAKLILFFNDGSGNFEPRSPLDPAPRGQDVVLADLSADGRMDLLIGSTLLLNDAQSSFNTSVEMPLARDYSACADLDGDGSTDLATIEQRGYPDYGAVVHVALNDGQGTLVSHSALVQPQPSIWQLRLADIDGDSDTDVIYPSFHMGRGAHIAILANSGDGILQLSSTVWAGSDLADFAVADADRDGDPDLIIASYAETFAVVVLLNDGAGHFSDYRSHSLNAGVDRLVVADLDSNGVPDWAATSSYANRVAVRLNPLAP